MIRRLFRSAVMACGRCLRALGKAFLKVRLLSRLNAIELRLMQLHACRGCGIVLDVTDGANVTLERREDGDYSVWCRWCYKVEATLDKSIKRRSAPLVKMG